MVVAALFSLLESGEVYMSKIELNGQHDRFSTILADPPLEIFKSDWQDGT